MDNNSSSVLNVTSSILEYRFFSDSLPINLMWTYASVCLSTTRLRSCLSQLVGIQLNPRPGFVTKCANVSRSCRWNHDKDLISRRTANFMTETCSTLIWWVSFRFAVARADWLNLRWVSVQQMKTIDGVFKLRHCSLNSPLGQSRERCMGLWA
jgi:hypothetical protein